MPPPPIVRDEHHWVGAAYVPLDEGLAKHANRRGSARLRADLKITVLEVMCGSCRRPFDEVAGQPCVLGTWLHGGPVDERAKPGPHDGRTQAGPDDARAVAATA